MGRKKKTSTQQPETHLLFTTEQKPTTPEVEKSSEDSTGGKTINDQSGEDSGSTYTQTDSNNDFVTSKESGSLLDSEEFVQDAIKRHKELVEQMGGYEAAQKRLALSRALLITYRNRGNSVKEIVEDVLQEYRDGLAKYGYIAVKKEMIPVVTHYGTIKDRAALCIICYFDLEMDRKRVIIPPTRLLTKEEQEEIKSTIRLEGKAAMVEFNNYTALYDTFVRDKRDLYRLKYAFLSIANQATIYFQTYEWLGKAEELLKAFSSLVDPNKQAEFRQLVDSYNSYIQSYQRFGELEEKSGERWLDRQRVDCLTYAEEITKYYVKQRLANLKGHIAALKLWIKKNGAEIFVPMDIRDQIEMIETKFIIKELQSKYYYSHLKYMEDHGQTPTDADRNIALFPEYDEVEPDEGTKKFALKKLDEYKKVY